MNLIKLISLIFILSSSLKTFSQDEDESEYDEDGRPVQKVPLCTSTLPIDEFVKVNNDIVAFTPDPFDHLKVTNVFKGQYTINYLIRDVVEGLWTNDRFKAQISDYYWGIKKNDYNSPIQIDPQNCISKTQKGELLAALARFDKDNKSPLLTAVKMIDFKATKELVSQKKFYLKNKQPDWESFEEVAKFLPDQAVQMLKNGFPAEDKKTGDSALFTAVENYSLPIALEALKKKANPNVKSKNGGNSPLLLAVVYGSAEITEALIKAGAKVESSLLCFVSGFESVGNDVYKDLSQERYKVAQILLNSKADINVKCGNSDVVTALRGNSHLPILKLFLKSGYKPVPNHNYDDNFFLPIWEKHPEVNSLTRKKYEQLKSDFESKDPVKDRDFLGLAFAESIKFSDFNFYRAIVDRLKPNLQFKYTYSEEKFTRCTTDSLRRTPEKIFLEYAIKNGLNAHFDCDDRDHNGNDPFITEMIKSCRHDHLPLFSDRDVAKAIVDEDEIEKIEFTDDPISGTFACLETLKYIKSKGNGIRDEFVINRFLKSNSLGAVKALIESGILSKESLDKAKESFARASLTERPISERVERYFLVQSKTAKTRVQKLANTLQLNFEIGKHYPLCSLDEQIVTEVGLKKKPIKLLTCKQLNPENLIYFEIKTFDEKSLSAIVISPNDRGYRPPGYVFGENVIMNRKFVTSAEIVNIGLLNIPMQKLGVSEVNVDKTTISNKGFYNYCRRSPNVQIPKGWKLVSLHEMDLTSDCLSNSGQK